MSSKLTINSSVCVGGLKAALTQTTADHPQMISDKGESTSGGEGLLQVG